VLFKYYSREIIAPRFVILLLCAAKDAIIHDKLILSFDLNHLKKHLQSIINLVICRAILQQQLALLE
jgi:hypothetical protein